MILLSYKTWWFDGFPWKKIKRRIVGSTFTCNEYFGRSKTSCLWRKLFIHWKSGKLFCIELVYIFLAEMWSPACCPYWSKLDQSLKDLVDQLDVLLCYVGVELAQEDCSFRNQVGWFDIVRLISKVILEVVRKKEIIKLCYISFTVVFLSGSYLLSL